MPTIKGPIRIKNGDISGFIKDYYGAETQLPFVASGWKSEKGMDVIPEEYKKPAKANDTKKDNKKDVEVQPLKEEEPRKSTISSLKEKVKKAASRSKKSK